MKSIIETERLRISPLQLEDAIFIKALVNSEGWIRYIGNRNVATQKEAEAYIQKIIDNGNYHYYVAQLKENKLPAGILSFIKRENHTYPDIGFAFLPQYHGKGLAYEASKAFLDKALKNSDWNNFIGITLSTNIPSIKLLERLGFQYSKTYEENGEAILLYALHKIEE